jgi:hypothetical protein
MPTERIAGQVILHLVAKRINPPWTTLRGSFRLPGVEMELVRFVS